MLITAEHIIPTKVLLSQFLAGVENRVPFVNIIIDRFSKVIFRILPSAPDLFWSISADYSFVFMYVTTKAIHQSC